MRSFVLALLLCISSAVWAQDTEDTEVEVKLFLPAHLKSELTAAHQLQVYFTFFPDDTVRKYPKKVIAKKIEGNRYTLLLPATKLWHIGFSIGPYSASMLCVNNRQGDAVESYSFDILLKKEKVDFSNMRFLPPCIRSDEED